MGVLVGMYHGHLSRGVAGLKPVDVFGVRLPDSALEATTVSGCAVATRAAGNSKPPPYALAGIGGGARGHDAVANKSRLRINEERHRERCVGVWLCGFDSRSHHYEAIT